MPSEIVALISNLIVLAPSVYGFIYYLDRLRTKPVLMAVWAVGMVIVAAIVIWRAARIIKVITRGRKSE